MGFSRQEYWSGVPLPSPYSLGKLFFSSKSGTNRRMGLLGELRELMYLENSRTMYFLGETILPWPRRPSGISEYSDKMSSPWPPPRWLAGMSHDPRPQQPSHSWWLSHHVPWDCWTNLTVLPPNNPGSKHQALKSSLFPHIGSRYSPVCFFPAPTQSPPHLMKPFHWALWNSRAVVGTPSCIHHLL